MKRVREASVDLDRIDRRILAVLQRDNQVTNLKLAEQVNLSPPTCLRRVRRLREEGIIVGDVSLVDPGQVGMNLFAFVEVVLDRQMDELQKAFEQKMISAPEVMQCYMVSGHTDFIVIVQVSDMAEYHEFVLRRLTNDPNIRNFRTLFAMHRTKFRTELHLGD